MSHLIIINITPGATVWINFLNVDSAIPIQGAKITFSNPVLANIASFELRAQNNITAFVPSGDVTSFEIEVNIPTGDTNVTFTAGSNVIGIRLKIDSDSEITLPVISGPPSLISSTPISVAINN